MHYLECYKNLLKEKLKEISKFSENFSNPSHIFEINVSDEKNKKFEALKIYLKYKSTGKKQA